MKKLIPAICMLLVSAVLLGSSTFAWFSMNKTVNASNMSITATADNPFLQISLASDTGFSTATTGMVATATDLKLVTPLNVATNVGYYADADAAESDTKTTPIKFTKAADLLWGTTTSSATDAVQADNVTTLVSDVTTGYAVSEELYFRVAGNTDNGTNLKLSSVTFTEGSNAISESARVLIVTETGKYMLYDAGTDSISGDAALLDTLTNTAIKATVYFYFDGTDADAYTDNATDLTAVTAALEFTID